MAKTYMCYTCNGDFDRGYWLDTGEAEEIFYCDEHAADARIIDSEHSRRQLPYSGYEIRTGFLAGNLFTESGDDRGTYDVGASAAKYAQMCREALEQEFPGADVSVPYEVNAQGATPLPLQTLVTDPDGGDYQPGDYGDGGRVADHVEDICERVWQSWEWVVYEEESPSA